ncbi:MAG: hypothetical protein IID39_03705 [Planctomycetes bacterium]|nr:hypothetical protein [Planctomycetota bacterium]
MKPQKTFVTIHDLSRRLGLPIAYLRREAETGRLPHVKAGQRLLFHVESAERALLERAEQHAKELVCDDR